MTLESALAAMRPAADTGSRRRDGREPRSPWSLAAGLLVLLAIGLVPGLLGTGWYLHQLREVAVRDAYAQADILAASASDRLRWLMQDAESALSVIAARPRVRALSSAECDPVLIAFRDVSPTFKTLSLRRADGASVCSDQPRPPSQASVATAPWFRAALGQPGLHVSEAHVGAVQQVWTARLTYPVFDPLGATAGLLITPIDLAQLSKRLFTQPSTTATVALIDGANRVLARSALHEERVGKLASEGVSRVLDEMRSTRVTQPTLPQVRQFDELGFDDVRRLFVVRGVPGTDWAVVAAVPEEDTLAGYYVSRNRSLVAIALTLLLAGLAAWRVARGILAPIRGLEAAARGMASGEPAPRAPEDGPREIRQVAGEFNRMVVAIGDSARQLRASESNYRTLLQHLPVAVVSHAADTAIEVFNDRACQLLRMTPDQLAGRQAVDEAWHFVDAQGRRLRPTDYPVTRVLATLQPLQPTVLGIVSAGLDEATAGPDPRPPHTWVMVDAYPQFDGGGQLLRVIVVFVDVTMQRQTEVLRVAKDAAEAASKAKSVFLSRVSHELRTPLNAINGFSELILTDGGMPQAVKDKVVHVFNAGRHLLALINQILDLTRIETGDLPLSLQPVPLVPLVDECLAICQPLAVARSITLDLAAWPAALGGDASSLLVLGEPTRLRQVLMNLLSNAIKYNRPGGRVTLRLVPGAGPTAKGGVQVQVVDSGPGLAPEQLDSLFQPFNRLGAEHSGVEGQGLGLVISRLLAQSMSGDISVRSVVGEGSTFTLHLRRAEATAAQPPGLAPTAVDDTAEMPPGRPLKVLGIDDDELNLQLLQQITALSGGIHFIEARDGRQGLARARETRPDLVLVDLGLPGLDGLGVLRHLQQEAALAGTPCWAVTADANEETASRARAAGFERVLVKPVTIAALVDALDGWKLSRRGRPGRA